MDVDSESLKAIISVIAAVIALISACITFWLSRRKEIREIFDIQIKYFDLFRKWAEVSADLLTEAIHLCDLDPNKTEGESFYNRRHRLLTNISNQIDKGRWFFPNVREDNFGKEKEIAYKGYRHEVLDGLVAAYKALKIMDYQNKNNNKSIKDGIISAKRHFVGCVQEILDPSGQQAEFRRITRRRLPRP